MYTAQSEFLMIPPFNFFHGEAFAPIPTPIARHTALAGTLTPIVPSTERLLVVA